MKKIIVCSIPVALATALFLPFSLSASIVVFQENFQDGLTGPQPVGGVDWFANVKADGAVFTETGSANDDGRVAIGSRDDVRNAFYFRGTTSDSFDRALIWTDTFTVDRSAGEILSFSWRDNNNVSSAFWQVAIQIDNGDWFVSNQSYTSASSWTQRSLDFTTAAADWSELNFTSGTVLAVGDPLSSDLPMGNVTAFGMYGVGETGEVQRLTDYTITVIPEPSAYAAILGLGAVALLLRRRFARKS
ncbi:MAG: PEP-CTERM sorting domain-containing protein [Opitutales bacterium]|nr:PEP-CTERM sorting domain-containing protein [Opitutales bacterium]